MSEGLLKRAMKLLETSSVEKAKAKKKKPAKPKGKSKTQKDIDDEIRRKRAERAAKKKAALQL